MFIRVTQEQLIKSAGGPESRGWMLTGGIRFCSCKIYASPAAAHLPVDCVCVVVAPGNVAATGDLGGVALGLDDLLPAADAICVFMCAKCAGCMCAISQMLVNITVGALGICSPRLTRFVNLRLRCVPCCVEPSCVLC